MSYGGTFKVRIHDRDEYYTVRNGLPDDPAWSDALYPDLHMDGDPLHYGQLYLESRMSWKGRVVDTVLTTTSPATVFALLRLVENGGVKMTVESVAPDDE